MQLDATERTLANRCLQTLEGLQIPGRVRVEWEPDARNGIRPDLRLRVDGPWGRGAWLCEVKRTLPPAAVGPVLHQLRRLRKGDEQGLLLTEWVTDRMAKTLREEDVQFLDAAGNAFLRQ